MNRDSRLSGGIEQLGERRNKSFIIAVSSFVIGNFIFCGDMMKRTVQNCNKTPLAVASFTEFMDLCKAFGTINHGLLIAKLHAYGFFY